jgi:hypothetical protein
MLWHLCWNLSKNSKVLKISHVWYVDLFSWAYDQENIAAIDDEKWYEMT